MFDTLEFNKDPIKYVNSTEFKFLIDFYHNQEDFLFGNPATRPIDDTETSDIALAIECLLSGRCCENISEDNIAAARENLSQKYISLVRYMISDVPEYFILDHITLYKYREIKTGLIILYLCYCRRSDVNISIGRVSALSSLGKTAYKKLKKPLRQKLDKEIISDIMILYDNRNLKNSNDYYREVLFPYSKRNGIFYELIFTAYYYGIITKEDLIKYGNVQDLNKDSAKDWVDKILEDSFFETIVSGGNISKKYRHQRNIAAAVKKFCREITT